ncbi:MAG: hypothetical protein AB1467_02025 [Candidatus Diapherotrites archaeon]
MLKAEFVFRELLFQVLEKKNYSFTQKDLAGRLGVSISNVNFALRPLRKMNAIKVNPRNFSVVNAKKILYYWASVRDLRKDIVYETRVEKPVREIERAMPSGIAFGAFSAFKFRFKGVPADYSEVYVYADELSEIKRRFPERKGNPNLFVLQKDELMDSYGNTSIIAQTFVDLWNLPEWYAKDFLKELEAKIDGLLE